MPPVSTDAPVIRMPVLTETLTAVWHLLFDLSEELPDNWCLIGGLMVGLRPAPGGPPVPGGVEMTRGRPRGLRGIPAVSFIARPSGSRLSCGSSSGQVIYTAGRTRPQITKPGCRNRARRCELT